MTNMQAGLIAAAAICAGNGQIWDEDTMSDTKDMAIKFANWLDRVG
jgi:hypothetical protein